MVRLNQLKIEINALRGDIDEGLDGPMYQICRLCLTTENRRIAEELEHL